MASTPRPHEEHDPCATPQMGSTPPFSPEFSATMSVEKLEHLMLSDAPALGAEDGARVPDDAEKAFLKFILATHRRKLEFGALKRSRGRPRKDGSTDTPRNLYLVKSPRQGEPNRKLWRVKKQVTPLTFIKHFEEADRELATRYAQYLNTLTDDEFRLMHPNLDPDAHEVNLKTALEARAARDIEEQTQEPVKRRRRLTERGRRAAEREGVDFDENNDSWDNSPRSADAKRRRHF